MPPDVLVVPSSPTYLTWLLGQSVAVVILVLWIVSLHRQLKASGKEKTALQKRNDELSDSLVGVLQESSRERAERRTNMLQTLLEAIEKSLGP